jgi:aminoglycoside 3-N-acetyltransferase
MSKHGGGLKGLVKGAVHGVRQALREKELERTTPHVDAATLAADLRALGLERGDVVFMHSSLKSLGYVEGGPPTLFRALLDAIGPEGTLVVPTYYLPGGTIHRTCQMSDYVFDPRVHGSNLGAVPDAFLKWPGVERSLHPTHSVSAVGPRAKYVTEAHHLAPSVFGAGSPWDRVTELDGKVLGLGITMGPVNYYHLLEDRVGERFPLPVRMNETYTLPVRDFAGGEHAVPVVPLDPQYMPRRIDHPSRDDLREYFWREFAGRGLLRQGPVGAGQSWWIRAQDFYTHLQRLMDEGITIYATPEQLASRPN